MFVTIKFVTNVFARVRRRWLLASLDSIE